MAPRSILVCGAGIAGPTLAYWLKRHGMEPVIVERSPDLRAGGQSVDVRGAGQQVLQRMGLEGAVRARLTHEEGVAFVNDAGRVEARLSSEAFGGKGFTAELEILRGEFVKVLYEATREDTEYLFNNRVVSVTERADRVRVGFLHGPEREFDLVLAADGIRSKTRELVFGDEMRFRSLGLYMAYFTIPRLPTDGTWAQWYNAPGGRSLLVRPDNVGTTRVVLSFRSEPKGYDRLKVADQKSLLRRVFAGAGWQVPRALAGLDQTNDFYFEATGQVLMPRWSKGRVALLGDAAYCASPISGMGTSLALVGAYVLAGELSRHSDPTRAFAEYERLMRPYVTRAQDVPTFSTRLSTPQTRAGIALQHTVLRLATAPGVRQLLGRFMSPPAESFSLPDYGPAREVAADTGLAPVHYPPSARAESFEDARR